MAKRRCAHEGTRFDAAEFAEHDGFLVHVGPDGDAPTPLHEAIEGRLLRLEGTTLSLLPSERVQLRTAIADNRPPA